MPKGVYDHNKIRGKKKKFLSEETKLKISKGRKGKAIGNKNSLGKNLNNKHALNKNLGNKNGNWKGGTSTIKYHSERIAGRPRSKYCESCGKKCKTYFDHDHVTGKFRGWICSNCNFALGQVKDSSEILALLIAYLERNKTNGD